MRDPRASAVAGFLASFFSLPFDNAKTKMQKMKKGPDGKFPYANIFDAMGKVLSSFPLVLSVTLNLIPDRQK